MWYHLRHAEVKVLLEAIAQLQRVRGDATATDRQTAALELARQKLLAQRKPTGFPALLNACDELAKANNHTMCAYTTQLHEFITAAHKVMEVAKAIQEGLDGG